MATCKWKPAEDESIFFEDGYECREAPWRDGVCIFHAPREEKTREAFEEAILSKIEREESDENAGFHDFRGYVFPDGFSAFSGASTEKGKEFRKHVDFTCAKFGNETFFADTTFGDKASFYHAKFGDKANFRNATFGDKVLFAATTFGNEAELDRATFGDKANFRFAAFGDEAELVSATFGDKASFAGATFGNKTHFFHATFGDEAELNGTTFGDKADFFNTTFGDKADFFNTTFGDEANFSHATFQGSVRFEGLGKDWRGRRVFEGSVNFRRVRFHKPETVLFYKANLSRALVSDVFDLDKFSFWEVRWASHPGCKHAIYDEFYQEEYQYGGIIPVDYALIARAYRQLMKNYDAALEYRVAGDFHVGAMRMEEASLRYHWHDPHKGRLWMPLKLVAAGANFLNRERRLWTLRELLAASAKFLTRKRRLRTLRELLAVSAKFLTRKRHLWTLRELLAASAKFLTPKGRLWMLWELFVASAKFLTHKCYKILSNYGEDYLRPLVWLVLFLLAGGVPDYRELPLLLFSGSFTDSLLAYVHAAAVPSLAALFLLALRRRFRR